MLSAVREQHRQGCSARRGWASSQGQPKQRPCPRWLGYSPTAHKHHGQNRVQETGSIQALPWRAAGDETSSKATAWIRRVHSRDKAKQQTTCNASPKSRKEDGDGQADRCSIAQEEAEGSGLSLNGAPGPPCGQRSQVMLLRAVNAY